VAPEKGNNKNIMYVATGGDWGAGITWQFLFRQSSKLKYKFEIQHHRHDIIYKA
jgi:hypothetical protein